MLTHMQYETAHMDEIVYHNATRTTKVADAHGIHRTSGDCTYVIRTKVVADVTDI